MNKKKMTFVRGLTIFVLTAIFCLGMAAPALASEGPISPGTEETNADTAITKMLVIAEGTEIPDSTFEFTFTPNEKAGETAPAKEAPPIGPVLISMSESDRSKANDPENGIVSVPKESAGSIFSDVKWPHAGVYLYTVKETKGNDEQINYSKGAYDIYVYVANKEDGSGLYIAGIGAKIAVNDDSNGNTSIETKVDPTPGGGGDEYSHSQIIFTNTYVKDIDETDPTVESNQKFYVGKTVTGDYGDHSKYFTFFLTIERPATLAAETTYKAYVVETINGKPEVVTSEKNHAEIEPSEGRGDYINVTTGSPIVINLTHGQKLVFTGIHDGASYFVEEAAAKDYTAKVEIVENGEDSITLSNSTPNTKRSTVPDGEANFMRIINSNDNFASFFNNYKDTAPMGISVDNLPYITLITLLIIAGAVYVAVKYRRRAQNEK